MLVVFYFIAVILDGNQKLRIMHTHIFRQAKRIFGIPSFHYYAIGDGLSAIFKRSPLSYRGSPGANNKLDQLNLSLDFR
jgi:hypothetical protein